MQKRKRQSRKGTNHQPLPEASEPEARKAGILLSAMFAAAFHKGGIEGRETGILLSAEEDGDRGAAEDDAKQQTKMTARRFHGMASGLNILFGDESLGFLDCLKKMS